MRRSFFCLVLLAASAGSALASGGLWCNADDASAKVDLRSGMQTGGAGGMFALEAHMEARLAGVASDFQKVSFAPNELAQHWLDRDILNLEFYREREGEPFGSVRLTIQTRSVEEGSFAGEYALSIFDTPPGTSEAGYNEGTGKVTCGVE